MLYLLEVVNNGSTESPALYPTQGNVFENEVELLAEFETKLGADMKADAYKAGYLLAFDNTGKIYGQKQFSKNGNMSLSPRLITVKTSKENGEVANQDKKTDVNILEADFHASKGSAMKDKDISAVLHIGFNGNDISINNYWVRPIEVPQPEPEVEPVEPTEPEEPTEE